MLRIRLLERRKDRPKRRYMDGMRTDRKELGLTEEDVEAVYPRWRSLIKCKIGEIGFVF